MASPFKEIHGTREASAVLLVTGILYDCQGRHQIKDAQQYHGVQNDFQVLFELATSQFNTTI